MSTITLRDDGIIFVDCWRGAEFVEADARDTLAKIDELTGGTPAAHCVDLRHIKSMERACRQIFATGRNTRAAALVVGNPLSRVIGNFFLGLSKTTFPLRLFTEPDAAIKWLQGQ